MLKKWEDEVLTYGWAFGSNGDKLQGKELLIAVTTGVDKEGYSPEGSVTYTVPELLRPFEATSKLIGTRYLTPYVLYGVVQQPDEQLEQRAKDYVEYALNQNLDILTVR